MIRRVEGDSQIPVAHFGSIRLIHEIGVAIPIELGGFAGRAVREARTLHVHDLRDAEAEFPGARLGGVAVGVRTALAVPLLKDGKSLGIIHIRRLKVQPFTEQQIRLVETFADQAVIAIENVRLFQELRESLEQQTATSEILGVIASSPTDIQPVLNTVAESAARLCDASDALIHRVDGDKVERVAVYGTMPVPETQRRPLSRGSPAGRAIIDRQTIHVHDVAAELTEFPDYKTRQPITGVRTTVCTPLLREGVSIGVITVRRKEVRPFTDKQIALLKTFADQAVIAIENVRLFKELKQKTAELESSNSELRETLEQQTATSEILSVISSSPTDVQPVFDAIAENSMRLCGALFSSVYRFDGELIHMVADRNYPSATLELSHRIFPTRPSRRLFTGRAILERAVVNVPDVQRDTEWQGNSEEDRDIIRAAGFQSVLSVPMLRGESPIGAITVWHPEVGPFSDRQIALLKIFADQAVIAIENVRLFKELQERNAELREALAGC